MYVGHVALALGAKGLRPATPLWPLVLAAQGADWLEVALRLVPGVQADLWSHGFVAIGAGAVIVGVLAARLTRSAAAGVLCALCYAAHLPADLVTGYKPTWPGGPWVGGALYARPVHDFALESGVLLAGWLLYRRSLAPAVRRRAVAWLPVAALVALQGAADLVFVRRYQPWLLPVDPVELLPSRDAAPPRTAGTRNG